MKEEIKDKTEPKKRAEKYEKPVKFEGPFDDLINISLTGAGAKKKEDEKTSSDEIPDSEIIPVVKKGGTRGG